MKNSVIQRERPFHARGEVAFLVLVAAWSTLCCAGEGKTPPPKTVPQMNEPLVETVELETLGGAEICFNGLDDNRNRLIDEGCGVAQSEVQFSLAWPDVSADFDLYVTDPDGQVAVSDGTTSLGLTLSADCPEDHKSCQGQNFENAYLEQPEPAPGKYRVRIRLERIPADARKAEATLGVRTPTSTTGHQMTFFAEGQEVFLDFEVAASFPKSKEKPKSADEDLLKRDD